MTPSIASAASRLTALRPMYTSCVIDGREWLAHPGSVGRVTRGTMSVRGPDFGELPTGETGEIWMRTLDGVPTYHYLGAVAEERDGWETLGDMGRFDADGYFEGF